MPDLPRGPWLHLSMDFCGPLPSGEYLMVLMDEYSRFPFVDIVCKTSADAVIPVVDKAFSLFAYPEVLKTDSGPPFQGAEWGKFLKKLWGET